LVASTLCSEGFDFPSCAGDLFPLKIELNLVCLDIEVELRPSSSGHGVLLADNTISGCGSKAHLTSIYISTQSATN
jgi:hypothetical protein